tara:strand:- start:15 stop:491 length:477 start_codon:yes stop_codon:yes gene_type:complete
MPQTSVTLDPNEAMDGQLNEAAPHFRESMLVNEATGIPFGRAVNLVSGALKTVDLTDATGEASAAYGVAARNPTYPADTSLYADNDGITVVRSGIVTVQVEDAVVKGAAPFIRFVAGGGGSALGSFRSDADTASAAENTSWEYLDNAAAAGFARVWIK